MVAILDFTLMHAVEPHTPGSYRSKHS